MPGTSVPQELEIVVNALFRKSAGISTQECGVGNGQLQCVQTGVAVYFVPIEH